MNRQTIDPRVSASKPIGSLRDLISPILSVLEQTNDVAELNLPEIRRQLRETYRLARDFEAEVSRLHWELRAIHDAERNEDERLLRAMATDGSKIVLFPVGTEVSVFQEDAE